MSAVKLNRKEWDLIERHLRFYAELEAGIRAPSTPAQEHFVEVCKGKKPPRTEHELAFRKWKFLEAEKRFFEAEKQRSPKVTGSARKASKPNAAGASAANTVATSKVAKAPSESAKDEEPIRSSEIIWPKKHDAKFWKLPEHEEGYPRTEFGTREEHKQMRGRQRHATKRGRHS
jgi:uncharacterized protein YifE (UPF0438 family)